MLKKLGISSDIAEMVAEAIKALRFRDYDLVFMDCQMPVLDGYQGNPADSARLSLVYVIRPFQSLQ